MTSTPSTSANTTTIPAGFSRRIKQSLKLRLQDEVDRDVTSTSGATTSAPIDVAACAQALSDILGYERKSRTGGTGVVGSSPGAPTKTGGVDTQSLRSVVERRGLALNESFLDASLRAQSKMTQVEATLRALDDARERMRYALDASNSKTAELLRESERAKENLKLIESRRDLVKSFAADFQLPKTFVDALSVRPTEDSSTNDEELPQHFFQALERVKAIQANCAKLANTDQQRAGLELMDVMTTYAESAHEKLRRWVIAKCRILAEDDDFITERDEKTLQKAVETLRQRPLLFKACVEEVTRTRHNALFRRFITALTRGGAGTKPIEVHAHDPLRYVGDMLSWVHQAVASEKEFCTMAFGSSEDGGGVVEIDGVAFDATQDVLKKVFDAICRPLKVRVEQVFVTSSGSVMEGGVMVAYKLANLMSFYKKLLFDLLGDEATLTKTIAGLKESAKTSFSDAVSQHSGKFKKTSLAPSAFAGGEDAVAPPSTLREGVSSAVDLLDAVASTSTSSSGGSEEESKELLSVALDGLIDPIVQAIETAAVKVGDQVQSVIGSAASGPKWVGDAFALNCLNAIREPLRLHSSAGGKVEEISRLIARKVSDIADSEAGGLLAASGLSDALELVVLYQEQGLSTGSNVMANDPALKIDRLAAALSSLVDAAGTKLPDFAQVQSPAIRRDVTNRYNSKLIEAYSRVYAAVLQPASGYPSDVRSRIRHGPDALSTVLGGA